MDLMEPDDSYQSEPPPAGIPQPVAFLAFTLMLALWIAKRHAGLPNPLWTYLTFSIAATGTGMLLISLRRRNDRAGKAAKLLGTAVGFLCVAHVLQVGIGGKQDLRAGELGIHTQVTEGVITCDRDHYEQRLDDFNTAPAKQIGWEEFYAYVVDGKVYHQRDYVPKPYFPIGTSVRIFYDIRQPERARLMGPGEMLPSDARVVPADQTLLPKPDPTHIAC